MSVFFWFVFMYPMNVKTSEPIGPKFRVVPQMTAGKVDNYDQNKPPTKFDLH